MRRLRLLGGLLPQLAPPGLTVSFQYTNLCGREAVIISIHGGVTALVTTLSVYSRARGRWTRTKLYTIMKVERLLSCVWAETAVKEYARQFNTSPRNTKLEQCLNVALVRTDFTTAETLL